MRPVPLGCLLPAVSKPSHPFRFLGFPNNDLRATQLLR